MFQGYSPEQEGEGMGGGKAAGLGYLERKATVVAIMLQDGKWRAWLSWSLRP